MYICTFICHAHFSRVIYILIAKVSRLNVYFFSSQCSLNHITAFKLFSHSNCLFCSSYSLAQIAPSLKLSFYSNCSLTLPHHSNCFVAQIAPLLNLLCCSSCPIAQVAPSLKLPRRSSYLVAQVALSLKLPHCSSRPIAQVTLLLKLSCHLNYSVAPCSNCSVVQVAPCSSCFLLKSFPAQVVSCSSRFLLKSPCFSSCSVAQITLSLKSLCAQIAPHSSHPLAQIALYSSHPLLKSLRAQVAPCLSCSLLKSPRFSSRSVAQITLSLKLLRAQVALHSSHPLTQVAPCSSCFFQAGT